MNYTFLHRPNKAPGGKKDTIKFPFRIDTIEAFSGFQRAGYIQLCHIPDAPWLNDPYWWLGMKSILFSTLDKGMRTEDDVRNLSREHLEYGLWGMITKIYSWHDANDVMKQFRALNHEQAVNAMLSKFIPEYMNRRGSRLEFMWDKRYHNECGMYTDFIRVFGPYRGTGLAERLYYRASLLAQSMGKRYRFSNTQSDPAKKVMQRFVEHGMVSTERRIMFGRRYEFNYLEPSIPFWMEK